jgi:hypothetical protein
MEPQTSTVSRWAGLLSRFLLIHGLIDLYSLCRTDRNGSKDKYGHTRYGNRYRYLSSFTKIKAVIEKRD